MDSLPATPSQWSPSIRGSPRTDPVTPEAIEEEFQVGGIHFNDSLPLPPGGNSFESSLWEDNASAAQNVAGTTSPNAPNSTMAPDPTSSYLSAPTPAQRPHPVSSLSPLQPSSAAVEASISADLESPLTGASSKSLPTALPSAD